MMKRSRQGASRGSGRGGGSRFGSQSREGGREGGYGSGGGRGGVRGHEGAEGRTRFIRKKVCRLCGERAPGLDYKDTERLIKFLTEKGKILPQRISGNCARHQRMLARAVKRARHASLVPFQIGV